MKKELLLSCICIIPVGMAFLCGCSHSLFEPIKSIEEINPETQETDSNITMTDTTITTTETTTYTTTLSYAPEVVSVFENMTLEEKVGQMILMSCSDENLALDASAKGAGGLCLFASPFANKTIGQVQEMIQSFQNMSKIPMLISVDEEGGSVTRVSQNPQIRASQFNSPRYLFSQGGWNGIINDTREKADLLLNLGINVNLAPVCDIPLHDTDYIYSRCFSMDASETCEYIETVVEIMHENKLGSTLKHFPGYGGSSDTHQNMAYDSRTLQEFQEKDLLPFCAGIDAGANSVMVSHNIIECMDPYHPASLSTKVHKLLREELAFEGVIISDDLNMNAIQQFTNEKNPAVAAVLAGNDMLCYANYDEAVENIIKAIKCRRIHMEQIDSSVLRILKWKYDIGIL